MSASDALGRWVLAKDTPVRMGVSIFTLRAGAEVKVLQVDPECGKVLVQAVRWLYVGNDWDEGHLRIFSGLRDPILDGFADPCMGPLKSLKDGKLVLNVRTEDFFTVDPEGASLLLEFELDRLLEMHDDPKSCLVTKGFMTYIQFGTIALAKNQVSVIDKILRRTAWKERHGLVGPGYDLDALMARSIPDAKMLGIPSELLAA